MTVKIAVFSICVLLFHSLFHLFPLYQISSYFMLVYLEEMLSKLKRKSAVRKTFKFLTALC